MNKFCTALIFLASMGSVTPTTAQISTEELKVNLKLDTRFDAYYKTIRDDGATPDKGGFAGRYLNLILDGEITPKFSYNFRYRLNRDPLEGDGFFHSVDWMNLTWHINPKFTLTAGKQIIYIGGFEYDEAPIDVYFWSDFWNNVTCYQVGFNAGYTSANKKHSFYLQMTNSPYAKTSDSNIYAYNFIWYGSMKYLQTIWSINMIEFKKECFITYFALGNRIPLGQFTLDADFMVRAHPDYDSFLDDYSLIGKLAYTASPKFRIFAKGGHDQNRSTSALNETIPDQVVLPGTEYNFYGAGVEYFPMSNPTLRLHAFWASNDAHPKTHTFNIGIRWQMQLLKSK